MNEHASITVGAVGNRSGDVDALLNLWRDRTRTGAEVKRLALARLAEIERKLLELAGLRHTLHDLAQRCHGDSRPDCRITEELKGEFETGSRRRSGGGDGRG